MSEQEFGFVISAKEVSPKNIQQVRQAAQLVGFDPELVKDIRPRNAFIRAARALVGQGLLHAGNKGILRDKIGDEAETVFQFSAREVKYGDRAEYLPSAILRFNKQTEGISVDPTGLTDEQRAKISQEVHTLFETAGYMFTGTDLNLFVDRLFGQVTRKVRLRDAVYFVPLEYQSLVFKVRDFFEKLGITFLVFPVGGNSAWVKQDISKALVEDIQKNVQALENEIKELQGKPEGDGLTARVAERRFKDLAKDLEHYRGLARSLHESLESVLEKAGDSGKKLALLARGKQAVLQMIHSGQAVDALSLVLADRAGKHDGKLIEEAKKLGTLVQVLNKPDQDIPVFETLVGVPQVKAS